MPWPQAASSSRSQPANPVMSAEALRVATLQASWARDRQVARRRLAWRWLVWAWWRYLLPATLVLGVAALLAIWLMPEANRLLAQQWSPAAPQASLPAPAPASRPAPSVGDPSLTAEGEPLDLGISDQQPLALRFDSRWAAPRTAAPAVPPTEDDTSAVPILKPENWLHSKEP